MGMGGDTMTVGERIKQMRKQLRRSAEEIAGKLKVSPSTIYRYENGEIEKMGIDKLAPIADALDTTPAYLMGWTDDPYDYEKDKDNRFSEIPIAQFEALMEKNKDDLAAVWRDWVRMQDDTLRDAQMEDYSLSTLPPGAKKVYLPNYQRIPILGRISAGLPLYAEQNIEGYTFTDLNGGAEYFALRVSGDSMNAAGINDGYLIIVRRQDEVENGEVAVVMVDGEDATVKRFYATDSMATLMPQSTNPIHQPQVYDLRKTRIKVLGKVVKVEFTL